MKEAHLTVRLPADLARALARWAKQHRVPKSHAAREAVARFLGVARDEPGAITARELRARWADVPRLDPDEADAMARDITAARAELPAVRPAWG
jgi:hypothetical protein